ncbi:MAG: exodeoxyribonuclease VII large subunit [Oscillospiraceae bacterium]|jgi:exodeoxyribonuclease VII large subunit|nr:exodeoxyribonuclease VII large subunit [Oscillospiraceae bacterium]
MDYNQIILTVSQVNTYIKSVIESDYRLAKVIVRGEISNFTNHYRTGHYYLTLKDEGSALRAVMFKSSNARLRFVPENGMAVIAFGRISVFERDGQYQLYLDDLQPDGAGALSVAYEQLKARLTQEGLFDSARKRPVPQFPQRVGVITSPTGAAVRDILQILGRRYPLAEVVLAPVLVQGNEAPGQMIAALAKINELRCCDVIIIGRGGGSIEELWAFNDEALVRAVVKSAIPVISAVGHETDFTLCDFAADLRAPTPSAAAELAVPDMLDLSASLLRLRQVLQSQIRQRLSDEAAWLYALRQNRYLKDPLFFINHQKQVLDFLQNSMQSAFASSLGQKTAQTKLLIAKLDSLSPLRVLSRGYAIASKDGQALTDTAHLCKGDRVWVKLQSGSFGANVEEIENDNL